MKETSSLQQFRKFKHSLLTAVADIGAKATPQPRVGKGAFSIEMLDDSKVELSLTYTGFYTSSPTVQFDGDTASVTNLSAENLKKHLLKRVAARKAHLAERELDDARDKAGQKAEDAMAKTLMTEFQAEFQVLSDFKHRVDDMDNHIWEGDHSVFKLAYVNVTGTPGNFEFEYNFEFDLRVCAGREVHLQGEFDAKTPMQIVLTIHRLIKR